MLMINVFQLLYVLDALWHERSILTTMDITSEGFGFMLAFGDLVWVPFTYCIQAKFISEFNPVRPPRLLQPRAHAVMSFDRLVSRRQQGRWRCPPLTAQSIWRVMGSKHCLDVQVTVMQLPPAQPPFRVAVPPAPHCHVRAQFSIPRYHNTALVEGLCSDTQILTNTPPPPDQRRGWLQGLTVIYMVMVTGITLLGYEAFRGANTEKDRFRRNPEDPRVKHLEAMDTARGTQLLVSGWWGFARHVNYSGDWLMGVAWCLTTGMNCIVPYFYAAYFFVLLVHRTVRDEEACRRKYGKDWDEYCKRVPWRFCKDVF